MQRVCFPLVLLIVAWAGTALAQQQSVWTDCGADVDCVVIDGPCSPAAVNKGYEVVASAHFKDRARKEKCAPQFWQVKREDAVARCRLERCEIVAKEK